MLNYALYLTLRFAAIFLPHVPLRISYGLASLAAMAAYHLVPSAREGILGNLQVAFPGLPESELVRLAKGCFRTDAQNWVDTLRIPTVDVDRLEGAVEVEGWQHVRDAVTQGKGVVLITLHLGNFDLVGQLIVARGLELTVPVEHMTPPQLFDFLVGRRESKGMHIVPVERAPRAILRALHRGEAVAAMADRAVAGKTVPVELFGRSTLMPRGPASLMRLSDAPALVAVGVRSGLGQYRAFAVPLEVARGGDAHVDDIDNTQRIAAALEGFVRRFPDQWLMFTPLWKSSRGEDVPATIGQHSKAAV